MRFWQILMATLLFTGAAQAAEWTSYSNARFGESIDIPPGFVNDVPEPENADGLTFHSADSDAELLVWGNNLVDENFRVATIARMQNEKDDGWIISYESGDKTSGVTWFVYSGSKADRIMYVRSIASCKDTQALHFRLEYPKAQKKNYDMVITRMGKSLKAGSASDCP